MEGSSFNLPFDEWTEMFGYERLIGALLDRLRIDIVVKFHNGSDLTSADVMASIIRAIDPESYQEGLVSPIGPTLSAGGLTPRTPTLILAIMYYPLGPELHSTTQLGRLVISESARRLPWHWTNSLCARF